MAPSWRDIVKVHPAASVFPMMPDDELDALAADIRENGLVHPVVLDTVVKKFPAPNFLRRETTVRQLADGNDAAAAEALVATLGAARARAVAGLVLELTKAIN